MKYYDVLEKRRDGSIYEVDISFDKFPEAGQFVSLIIPNENEIPLGVGDYDYERNILKLYIESERLFNRIGKRVLIKGPLGNPINLTKVKKVIGIAKGEYYHDLIYPLKMAKLQGIKVYAKCINCKLNYEEPTEFEADLFLVSLPFQDLSMINLPKEKTIVYVRWVKMNCMLGVCGVCEVKGNLVCIKGPFMRLDEIVD